MFQEIRHLSSGAKKSSPLAFPLLLLSFSLLTFLLLTTALSGCRNSGKKGGKSLTIAGSTTILPIVQAAGEEYQKRFPRVRVLVQGGGSSAGIEAVSTGAADIGTSSRELTEEEAKLRLRDFTVAIDAIAVIVNPKNPVDNLSARQLREIFSGKISNWQQVGGRRAPIILVNRDEASGTREAFAKAILGKADFTKDAVIQPGSGQVRAIVAGAPDAIGYISLGYVTPSVKTVGLDGATPTIANVKSGKYGLRRKLHLLTRSKPSSLSQEFVDFLLSPEIQKKIVGVEFLPVR